MKTKPQQLKELLEDVNYPHLMQVIDNNWFIDKDEVGWNTEDNLLDLCNQEGETYGGELPEGVGEWEGHTVANYDTGCGQWITLLLNNEKQVTVEQLESLV